MNQRELENIQRADYIEWNNLPYMGDSKNLPPIYELGTMVRSSGHDITFSKDIWVSENYRRTYNSQTNLLDDLVKPANFFLLMKDPRSSELKALLITPQELEQLTGLLDTYKKSNTKQLDFWIVSSHGVPQNATQNEITPSDPLYPNYSKLLSQIQFYNGDLDLCLKQGNFDWFNENKQEKLDFLENVVLPNYPEKRKHFQKFMEKIQGQVLVNATREKPVEETGSV